MDETKTTKAKIDHDVTNTKKNDKAELDAVGQVLLKIIGDGCEQFKNDNGRPMTYSEMRARFG